MNIGGFPDLIRVATFNQDILTTKTNLATASRELVTGRQEDLARVLGGRAGEYNLITKALADIESSGVRMTLAENRLAQTGVALSAMHSSVSSFSGDAQAALLNNGAFGLSEVQESARSQIKSVLSLLNTTHAGRSLFSGDEVHGQAILDSDTLIAGVTTAIGGATDEASIDAAITAYFAPGGDFDTVMYQGGAGQAASVQLSTGATVDYGVKADNAAFRDTLEGLVRVNFATNSTSVSWADDTTAKLSSGLAGLVSLQANLGRQQNLVDEAVSLAEQEKLILNESRDAMDGVDPYEAATRVQALEAQLQAAYTVASRLSSLTFTSYL